MAFINLHQPLFHQLPSTLSKAAREKPLFLTISVAGTLSGVWWILRDYSRWKALGPGGAPSNPLGWLRVSFLIPIAISQRRITDTVELDNIVNRIAEEEGDCAVFRSLSLPQRPGDRPQVRGIIPQRQISNRASKALTEELKEYLMTLASDYPTLLRIAPCAWEGGHNDALYLRRPPAASESSSLLSIRTLATVSPRLEIAHVHATDGSLHIPLSPADAAEVIRKGWGVRHRLAGKTTIPTTYVLVFAPRDADQVAVVKRIVAATVEYTTGLSKVA